MKQLKTQLQHASSTFGRKARHVSIALGVTALTTGQAFAEVIPIKIDGIEAQIQSGATSSGTVAGYVALALAVLACAGVIFSMLRKA
ncbi:capsid protein [Pseudomonas tohonis]|jgi:hypothetical protein|uniref:capsid protein n=1 Tax=Pseudomonas tohonis TaxID=2725477 RepID=UPI001F1AF8F3|nr:capsid protein [Pseudomonas tohonis]